MPLDYQTYLNSGAYRLVRADRPGQPHRLTSESSTSRQPSAAHAAQSHDGNYMYQLPNPVAHAQPPPPPPQEAPEGPTQANGNVRVVQGRPKPRCWEHGCNGRQFSTFSNLLRHQREKSGQSAKSSCPNCGAEFTRTTARNGHMLHDKCKRRSTASS